MKDLTGVTGSVNPNPKLKHLVLLGAGHAHLFVLEALAKSLAARADPAPKSKASLPYLPPDWQVTVVAPHARSAYSGMVPGHIAGHYSADDCLVDTRGLMKAAGVRWLEASVSAMSAGANKLLLRDLQNLTQELPYDLLSVNTGGSMERDVMDAKLPGSRANAVFVRPMDGPGGMLALWPQITQHAQRLGLAGMSEHAKRPFRFAVLGAGAAGLELAMAVAHALPEAAVTLLCPPGGFAPGYPARVREMLLSELIRAKVHLLERRCVRVEAGELILEGGASLACDVPLVATGSGAAHWLVGSGLQRCEAGFVAVNAHQQSPSHANVFAAGDVSTRVDRPHPRSGVYAVRAGPALARNLSLAAHNQPLLVHPVANNTLNLLSCGSKRAVMSYGSLAVSGAWVWHWKDRIDRRFMRRFNLPQ